MGQESGDFIYVQVHRYDVTYPFRKDEMDDRPFGLLVFFHRFAQVLYRERTFGRQAAAFEIGLQGLCEAGFCYSFLFCKFGGQDYSHSHRLPVRYALFR